MLHEKVNRPSKPVKKYSHGHPLGDGWWWSLSDIEPVGIVPVRKTLFRSVGGPIRVVR